MINFHTRQACHPNDINFPFNIQLQGPSQQGPSQQETNPTTRETSSNCGRSKTCEMPSSCTSVREPQALLGKILGINVWLMHITFQAKAFRRRVKGPLTGLFGHLAGGMPHSEIVNCMLLLVQM